MQSSTTTGCGNSRPIFQLCLTLFLICSHLKQNCQEVHWCLQHLVPFYMNTANWKRVFAPRLCWSCNRWRCRFQKFWPVQVTNVSRKLSCDDLAFHLWSFCEDSRMSFIQIGTKNLHMQAVEGGQKVNLPFPSFDKLPSFPFLRSNYQFCGIYICWSKLHAQDTWPIPKKMDALKHGCKVFRKKHQTKPQAGASEKNKWHQSLWRGYKMIMGDHCWEISRHKLCD